MANDEQELHILEEIERNPETTQATLAAQLGVAVGSVNWYVKRLVGKGYVKVTHLQRRKLHYFLTPAGLALKFKLTRSYMDVSLALYRELRVSARQVLAEVREAGYSTVHIEGDDEAAEILHLTCLEQGIRIEIGSDVAPMIALLGGRFVISRVGGGESSQVDQCGAIGYPGPIAELQAAGVDTIAEAYV